MEVLKALLWFVAILVPVSLVGILIVGGGDGHWEDSGLVRIHRPENVVYEWLITPEKRCEWVEGLVECRAPGIRRLVKGTELREVFQVDGKRTERTLVIVELEHGKLVVLKSSNDYEDLEVRYEFEFSGSRNQTLVRVSCEGQYHGLPSKVIEPLLGLRTFHRIENDLERLAEMVRRNP
ncbi:MAG: hypothetical protein O7B99_04065 [Planctomycetota bacterium]|nr:hypothetical protein [Planctomycetota bacterium]